MDVLKRLVKNVDELTTEVKSSNLTMERYNQIDKAVDAAIEQCNREIPILLRNIRMERIVLRYRADQIYTLLSSLTERFNRIPAKFRPGILKNIWHLGLKTALFKNPLNILEELIQFAIEHPNFNNEEFKGYLKRATEASNAYGKLLDQAERKLITYRGTRKPDWPTLAKTYKEEIREELEFYEQTEALRPCTPLTNQWMALVKCRNRG